MSHTEKLAAENQPLLTGQEGQSPSPVESGLIPDEGQPTLEVQPEPDAARLFDPSTMGGASLAAITGLLERYMVPPFTVLDRRQGYWQERANQWKGLGIESELGRESEATAEGGSIEDRERQASPSSVGTMLHLSRYKADEKSANLIGAGPLPEWADNGTRYIAPASSIFDPVLCEIAYHWFCPPKGLVLDPFAGGSVRGILAAAGGRRYVGIDLSRRQCSANRAQAARIFDDEEDRPLWVEGDSRKVLEGYLGEMPDMIFTCPPYGDLEVYSDDPADLSNMPAKDFARVYTEIISEAVAVLRQDSFAAIVVGNYRDKRGMLHDLGGLTVRAFNGAGARFYNEAIIIDPVGTAAVRAPRQFDASRKLVRCHQQMLVFVKGDPKVATAKIRSEAEGG